ncbi:DNA ligase 1-like [Paralichthys olivaceus]|uniref:DNA ligase 1-like n=1 Tax=Paralichthys olivaceus TaxID=8255 RepID=UPI00375206AE
MSDCEDGDFFWESWISSGKRKRKKNSQKDKKCVKHKDTNGKTDESSQRKKKKKKKKKPGFKEAMGEWKNKTKEKKGKKKKSSVGFEDSFIFTQGHAGAEPESSHGRSTENVTEDSRKKSKRKKKVAFASSPGSIAIKRPKFASSLPKEQTHDNDSQCTSDDINSQDLFITQKTFRTSPVESSSGEVCDRALTQPERRLHPSHEGSNTRLQESYPHPERPRATRGQTQVLGHTLLKEEEGEGEVGDTNLTKETRGTRRVKFWGVNPFLDDPVELKSQTKTHSCTSSQQSPSCPRKTPEPSLLPQKSNTSTQTENFFTAEFSSFLNFCQTSRGAVCFEDLKPLDLSLPQRARSDPGRCLSGDQIKDGEGKTSSPRDKMSSNGHEDAGLAPSLSSDVEKESSGRQRCSVGAQRKVKTTPSPQSESDPKSTDTTMSSEDNETACCTGKLDMAQVRAVQMRLNESFFFKTKGEECSHRPESPLMKLAQGREMKSRKGH